MAGVGWTPRRSVAAEDIRDLQSGTHHAGRALGRRLGPLGGSSVRRSSGLMTARITLVATCV